MKKNFLTLALAATFTLSSFSIRVHAEESTTASLKALAGITPDSILYPFDKLLDEIRIIFSFTDGSKVETLISIAQERLGESEVMIEAGKNEEALEALDEYKEIIERANEVLDNAAERAEAAEDEKKSEELAELEEKLAEEKDAAVEVIENIQERVEDGETREALSIVIEMQIAKREAVRAMVDARHQLNAARKDYNMARVELKKAQKSNDAEAIAKAEELLKNAEEAYGIEQTNYSEAFLNKQTVVKRYAGMKIADVVEENEDAAEIVDNSDDIDTEDNTSEVDDSDTEVASEEDESEAVENMTVTKVGELEAGIKTKDKIKGSKKPELSEKVKANEKSVSVNKNNEKNNSKKDTKFLDGRTKNR
jgi:hypothetical protein